TPGAGLFVYATESGGGIWIALGYTPADPTGSGSSLPELTQADDVLTIVETGQAFTWDRTVEQIGVTGDDTHAAAFVNYGEADDAGMLIDVDPDVDCAGEGWELWAVNLTPNIFQDGVADAIGRGFDINDPTHLLVGSINHREAGGANVGEYIGRGSGLIPKR